MYINDYYLNAAWHCWNGLATRPVCDMVLSLCSDGHPREDPGRGGGDSEVWGGPRTAATVRGGPARRPATQRHRGRRYQAAHFHQCCKINFFYRFYCVSVWKPSSLKREVPDLDLKNPLSCSSFCSVFLVPLMWGIDYTKFSQDSDNYHKILWK